MRGSAAGSGLPALVLALALAAAPSRAEVPDEWWAMRLPEPMHSIVAKDIQNRLVSLDCFTGRADGVVGPDTERAIRDWQRASGLPETGVISEPLVVTLLTQQPWDVPSCAREAAR